MNNILTDLGVAIFVVSFGFTYFAMFKVGYYQGRLDELKDTKRWLDKLYDEAKAEAAKKALTKPAAIAPKKTV